MPEQNFYLTLKDAKRVAKMAAEKANSLGVPGAIAVVDAYGGLIYLEKLDGTMPAAANIAIGKAATAAVFARPTGKLESLIQDQRISMLGLTGVTQTPYVPLMGAYPLTYKGEIIGAVSVAGALTGENDEIIARHTSSLFQSEV